MQFALVAGAVAVVLAFTYGTITYVYRDAPRRGMNPGQWAGVMALTVGLGLVPYVLLRDDAAQHADDGPTSDVE